MRDLSKMTDEQLMQIAGVGELSQKSDAELRQIAGLDSEKNVVDEAHPAVSWKDRAVVKNLAQGSGLSYMQEKYPNLQVEEENDGSLIFKGKNEKDWRKLDPSSLELADVTDIAYDVASGMVEGGSAVAGGLTAGPMGAMAGAGMSASALEALRQKLGQFAGVNEGVDLGDVAKRGIGSALLTPLLGVGGGSKAIREMTKKGLSAVGAKEAAEGVLTKKLSENLQKGVIGTGYKSITRGFLPKVAQVTSGVKSKNFKDYVSNLDLMDKWKANPETFFNAVEKSGMDFEMAIKNNIKKAGSEMGTILRSTGDDFRVDLTTAVDGFSRQIDTLRASEFPREVELGDKMAESFADIFIKKTAPKGGGKVKEEFRNFVTFDEARRMGKMLLDESKFSSKNLTGSQTAQNMAKFGRDAHQTIAKLTDDSLDAYGRSKGKAYGKAFKATRERYRDALSSKQLLKKFTTVDPVSGKVDYNKTFDALRTLDNPSKMMLKRSVEKINPDIIKQADIVEAYAKVSQADFMPVSGTSTSTTRTIAMGTLGAATGAATGAGGLGGGAGQVIGAAAGMLGLGPKAWRFYLTQGKRGEKYLAERFRQAGTRVPRNIKDYFNKQMAAQSIWGTMQNRSGDKKKGEY